MLDGHGGLVGENGHDGDVVVGEAARFVHDVQYADDPAIDVQGHGEQGAEVCRPLVDMGMLKDGRVIQHHRLTLAHDLARQRAVHRHGFDGRQRLAQAMPDLQPGLVGQQ